MFIAPAGAMQFEYNNPRSEIGRRFLNGTVIWIYGKPEINTKDDLCRCRPKFSIILETLPSEIKQIIKGTRYEREGMVVCPCVGRIIE